MRQPDITESSGGSFYETWHFSVVFFCSIDKSDAQYVKNEQIEGNISLRRDGYRVWFWPTHFGARVYLGDGNEKSELISPHCQSHSVQQAGRTGCCSIRDLIHLPLRGIVKEFTISTCISALFKYTFTLHSWFKMKEFFNQIAASIVLSWTVFFCVPLHEILVFLKIHALLKIIKFKNKIVYTPEKHWNPVEYFCTVMYLYWKQTAANVHYITTNSALCWINFNFKCFIFFNHTVNRLLNKKIYTFFKSPIKMAMHLCFW